jgi:hypothetical protein
MAEFAHDSILRGWSSHNATAGDDGLGALALAVIFVSLITGWV